MEEKRKTVVCLMDSDTGMIMEINTIPEAFQTKLRLAILSAILTGEKNFRELKSITEATDGNLGAQIKKLEEAGYLTVRKEFVNSKPQTTCSMTDFGRKQFREYVEMLERLLGQEGER